MKLNEFLDEDGNLTQRVNYPNELIQMIKYQRAYKINPKIEVEEIINVAKKLAIDDNLEIPQGQHYAESIMYLIYPKKELLNGIKQNFDYLVNRVYSGNYTEFLINDFTNDLKRKLKSGLITEKEIQNSLKK